MFQFKFSGNFINSMEPLILVSSQIEKKPLRTLELTMEKGVLNLELKHGSQEVCD